MLVGLCCCRQSFPTEQVGILVQSRGYGLQENSRKLASATMSALDDAVEHVSVHAAETDLKLTLVCTSIPGESLIVIRTLGLFSSARRTKHLKICPFA